MFCLVILLDNIPTFAHLDIFLLLEEKSQHGVYFYILDLTSTAGILPPCLLPRVSLCLHCKEIQRQTRTSMPILT